jgi:hypothetical protein
MRLFFWRNPPKIAMSVYSWLKETILDQLSNAARPLSRMGNGPRNGWVLVTTSSRIPHRYDDVDY